MSNELKYIFYFKSKAQSVALLKVLLKIPKIKCLKNKCKEELGLWFNYCFCFNVVVIIIIIIIIIISFATTTTIIIIII